MLLNYHVGRFVLVSLCVGDLVRFGLSSIRVAGCFSLQHGYYRTIILPVVLYGRETWSLSLREERRLRVFENRELRRIFGPKRDKITGEWRKPHNEELNDLFSSPNITRMIK